MQPPLRKKFASFAHGKIQIKFKKKTLRELAKGGIKFEIQAIFFSCIHDINELLLQTKLLSFTVYCQFISVFLFGR